MNKKIWFLAMLLVCQAMQARYISVKKESQFLDEINKYEFVITCFLPSEQDGVEDHKQLRKDIKQVREVVKAVSESDPYHKILKNEVGFVIVDTSRQDFDGLVKEYNISADEQPQFLLFKNGKALTVMSGKLATLSGFVAKSDLLDFMNDYFGKDFDDILEKKSHEEAQNREMQLARYKAYGAYRYPYGAYAPYNPWGSPGPYIYSGYAQFYPYGYGYNGYAFFIP